MTLTIYIHQQYAATEYVKNVHLQIDVYDVFNYHSMWYIKSLNLSGILNWTPVTR